MPRGNYKNQNAKPQIISLREIWRSQTKTKSQTNPKSEIQNSKRIQNSEFKIQTDSYRLWIPVRRRG